MIGRAGFGAMLVACAFVLDAAVICGLFFMFTSEIKMDAANFGILTGFLGTITGTVNALAAQPVSWAFGSTAGSAKKDDTISALAGKG